MADHYFIDSPRCQHVKDDGIRCGSPALHGQAFCYNHHQIHHPRFVLGDQGYQVPILETAQSIQMVMRQILQAYCDKKIDDRQARLLIYGIQTIAPYSTKNHTPISSYVATEIPPAMQQLLSAGAPSSAAVAEDGVVEQPPVSGALSLPSVGKGQLSTGPVVAAPSPATVGLTEVVKEESPERMEAGRPRPADAHVPPFTAHTSAGNSRVAATDNSPARSAGYPPQTVIPSPAGTIEPADADHPNHQITSSPDSQTSSYSDTQIRPISNLPSEICNSDQAVESADPTSINNQQSPIDNPIRASIFHLDPEKVRAYWTQHLPPDVLALRAPNGEPMYEPPTWLPLTEEQLAYLRNHLPPDNAPGTQEEQENWRRMTLHLTHGHVQPAQPDNIRKTWAEMHTNDKHWNALVDDTKKCPKNAGEVIRLMLAK